MSAWRSVAGLVAAVALGAAGGAADDLRYALEPGRELVYVQTLERQTLRSSPDGTSLDAVSRMEWRTHVLVTRHAAGVATVGVQRNRLDAALLRNARDGENDLAAGRRDFDAAVATLPARFAEANRFDATGAPYLPWVALRERDSDVLYGLHEILALPDEPQDAVAWSSGFPLGLRLQLAGTENWRDDRCRRIEGRREDPPMRFDFTFCPKLGAVVQAEFEGNWPAVMGRVRERWTIALEEDRPGGTIAAWLADPQRRLAALAAIEADPEPVAEPRPVLALLGEPDVEARRRVLRLVLHGRLDRPARERLDELALDADARTAALARTLLDRTDSAADSGTADGPGDAIDEPSGLPRWFCEERPGWTERVKRRVRYPAQPAGLTSRAMRAPGFEGWPYMVYVPDTYRPDRANPVLIYLSGAQGRAALGVSVSGAAIEAADGAGALVVFPEADGYWWHARSVAIVEALLDEILRTFNVDPDRVHVAGFSNGGTGALHLATLWPHRFAGVVSLMGAGAFPPEAEPPLLLNAAGLPLAFVHGADDRQIAADVSRRTARQLERAGARSVELTVLRGREHDLAIGSDDGRTFEFVGRQVRDALPRRITFQARELDHPRHYWIELLGKDAGLAEVRGEWTAAGRLKLDTRRVTRLRLLLRRELLPADLSLRVEWNGREVFAGSVEPDCATLHGSLGRTADPWLAWSAEIEPPLPDRR